MGPVGVKLASACRRLTVSVLAVTALAGCAVSTGTPLRQTPGPPASPTTERSHFPTRTASAAVEPTQAPALTHTTTATVTHTPTPPPTATATTSPTSTPTLCSVDAVLGSLAGARAVEMTSSELAQWLAKALGRGELPVESLATDIHADGVLVVARVELASTVAVTATAKMRFSLQQSDLLLEVQDVQVEGAPTAAIAEAARLLVLNELGKPENATIRLPYGQPRCVELAEGRIRVAVLWHTPTPTTTPLSPQALATLFPENAVYGLTRLARGGARIVAHSTHDFWTTILMGLYGEIKFPASHAADVRQLVENSLDPVLTAQMVMREHREGVEEYCGCTIGVRLGSMDVDVCWRAGTYADGTYGMVFTRLPIPGAKDSPEYYQVLTDWERLRPR